MEPQDEQELESANLEMIETTEQTNHPWHALTTVTTFDQGNIISTLRVNNISESQNNEQVTQQITSTGVLVQSLVQQLCSLLEEDKTRRNKLYYAICDKLHELKLIDDSYNMIEFERLRGRYQHALYHLMTVAHALTGSKSSLCIPSCLMSEWSRYRTEFREVSFIASGGFGNVYKALHRLDGTEYAIKKIVVPFRHIKIIERHLDEVKTLATLNHANIISYKAAWIEPISMPSFVSSMQAPDHESHSPRISETKFTKQTKSNNLQSTKDSSSNRYDLNLSDNNKQNISFSNKTTYATGMFMDAKMKQQNRIYRSSIINCDIINKRFQELNSSTNIIGTRIVNESSTQEYKEEISSDVVSFRNSNSNENLDKTNEDNTEHTDHSYLYEESISNQKLCTYSNKNQQYMILYIQMALCEQTLEQWMRDRINITPEPIIRDILQQIFCGVHYIHSKKIVHHDIKPGNIFISTSGQLQIQLGDFGLACPLQREGHHSVMGTRMYAAPEQLQGKCDPKSDIYSVGIVLIELLIPTKTQMELISLINYLKCGNIPEALTIERHKWAHLIMQLVQEDPAKRPLTNQLLQDLNEEKNMITGLKNTVVTLENDNHDKDNTIHALQNRIALLEEQVKKLKLNQQDTQQSKIPDSQV